MFVFILKLFVSRLSLKIEALAESSSTVIDTSSKEDMVGCIPNSPLRTPHKSGDPRTLHTPQGSKFVPQHRKTRSLGTK